MKLTGIILAGGRSSRIGEDKSFLRLGGLTLLERAINNLEHLCSEIIISKKQTVRGYEHISFIPDEIECIGPMGGLYSCLKKSKTETNIVLSVDAPFVNNNLLNFLLSNSVSYDTTVLEFKNRIFPMPGVYKRRFLKILEDKIKNKDFKMVRAIKKSKNNIIDTSEHLKFFNDKYFININTKNDLLIAEKFV